MATFKSKDGTQISYTKTGSGPAIVLVDGAGSYRKIGTGLFLPPELSKHFTVYTYDRRGRGESRDTQPYSIEREIEDLQAIMDIAGNGVYLYGHSSGAVLALYAVAAGVKPAKLVLYEPPLVVVDSTDEHPPTDAMQQLQARIKAGDLSAAMKYWMTQVIGMPSFVPLMLSIVMRKHWKNMVAAANTLPYDLTIVEKSDWSVPTEAAKKVTVPTLVMSGAKSVVKLQKAAKAVGAAIPGAETRLIEGVGHNVTPKVLVPILQEFCK